MVRDATYCFQGTRRASSIAFSFYVAAVVKPPCVCFFLHSGRAVAPDHDCSGAFLWYGHPASRTTDVPCGLSHPSTVSRCLLSAISNLSLCSPLRVRSPPRMALEDAIDRTQ